MAVNFLNFRKLDQKYFEKFPLMLPTRYIYGILENNLKNFGGYLYPMELSELEEIELKKKIEKVKREELLRRKKVEKVRKDLEKVKAIRNAKCENLLIQQIGVHNFQQKYGFDENGNPIHQQTKEEIEQQKEIDEAEFKKLEERIMNGELSDRELS